MREKIAEKWTGQKLKKPLLRPLYFFNSFSYVFFRKKEHFQNFMTKMREKIAEKWTGLF